MIFKKLFLPTFLLVSFFTFGQNSAITLEDIWIKGTFRGEGLNEFSWMKDENFYTAITADMNGATSITKYRTITGEKEGILVSSAELVPSGQKEPLGIDAYELSPDQQYVLLSTETEPIYRRSSKSNIFLFHLPSKKITRISDSKVSNPEISPDGKKIAYIKENDLYFTSLDDLKETRVSFSGMVNKIINGSTDWVYEEEFEFTKAYVWSPDSKRIAFYTFDESEVKEYNMQIWGSLYPSDYTFKYPKAGEKNSEVSLSCYSISENKTIILFSGKGQDLYIPRMQWTQNPDLVSYYRMNRLQNQLSLIHVSVSTLKEKEVYSEKSESYIEINDNLHYLQNDKGFLLTSEKDGYRHIYLYGMDGKLITQLTKGEYEVDKFIGADEKRQILFYTSTEASPLYRHLYTVGFDGKKKKQLTEEKGVHEIEKSPSLNFFLDIYSSINAPATVKLTDSDGKALRVLSSNVRLKQTLSTFNIQPIEYFNIKNENGNFNGWMLKPSDANKTSNKKKYPVMLFVYGGPGHQTVKDEWMGPNFYWFQMLAQKGFIVVSVDVRGSGGRGEKFKKVTQGQLGKLETMDLIATSKYLSALEYVDGSRIGIFGWSYGGYLSSLAMTLGADFFKAGIAVAPVTNWRFYDTIYTERYLGLPQDNEAGYDNYSPLSHAGKLKGPYLLIHGSADDNVHLQNSIEMVDALVNANKQFEQFIYPNKNHGIYGGYTRFHLYKKLTDFIDKNL